MLKKKYNPHIHWKSFSDIECLYFTFNDILREKEALIAIERWNKLSEERDSGLVLIWDCQKMKNYESKARIAWQNNLKTNKDKIDAIWIVTKSIAIQAGADIISYFTSFKLNVVSSTDELMKSLHEN